MGSRATHIHGDGVHAVSESDKPCKGEKREKAIKITETRDISVLASSPSVSPPGSQSMISQ